MPQSNTTIYLFLSYQNQGYCPITEEQKIILPANSPMSTPPKVKAATVLEDLLLLLEINRAARAIGKITPRTILTQKKADEKVAATAADCSGEAPQVAPKDARVTFYINITVNLFTTSLIAS